MKILVDGTLTWDELMTQAAHGKKFFSNTSDLSEKNFPIFDKSKRFARTKLFKINKNNFWLPHKIMEKENYRAAHIEELFAYAIRNPEAQLKYDIMSIGQAWMSPSSGQNYPCLSEAWIGRYIGLSSINYQKQHHWKETRFLGIKKD